MAERSSDNIPAILQIINAIPAGRVATYGQIAHLAGLPGHARQVGYILRQLPTHSHIPWHRVINAQGRSSLNGDARAQQLQRLAEEQVTVEGPRIDLRRYQWQP